MTEHVRNVFWDQVAFGVNLGRTARAGLPCGLCLWSAKASLKSKGSSKFCLSGRNVSVTCLQLQVTESQLKLAPRVRGFFISQSKNTGRSSSGLLK